MAKVVKLWPKPQTRPIRWDICRAGARARLIGTVEALTADDAIKVAAAECTATHHAMRREQAQ